MAGHHRQQGMLRHIVEPGLVQVGYVRQNAQAAHRPQKLEPRALEPEAAIVHGGIPQLVFMVPGQRDQPDARGGEFGQPFRAALQHLAALDGQDAVGRRGRRLRQRPVNQRHAQVLHMREHPARVFIGPSAGPAGSRKEREGLKPHAAGAKGVGAHGAGAGRGPAKRDGIQRVRVGVGDKKTHGVSSNPGNGLSPPARSGPAFRPAPRVPLPDRASARSAAPASARPVPCPSFRRSSFP